MEIVSAGIGGYACSLLATHLDTERCALLPIPLLFQSVAPIQAPGRMALT